MLMYNLISFDGETILSNVSYMEAEHYSQFHPDSTIESETESEYWGRETN